MRKRLCLLMGTVILLVTLSILGGCSSKTKGTTMILMLVDSTGSTYAKPVRDSYLQKTNAIIDELRGGEIICLKRITSFTLSDANNALITIRIPEKGLSSRFKLEKEKMRKKITEYIFDESGISKNEEGTDLLTIAQLAFEKFEEYKADSKKIIILSDLVHQSSQLNLSDYNLNLTSQVVADIMLKNAPKYSLDGVEVYTLGGRDASLGEDKQRKVEQLEYFWKTYFEYAGAKLYPEKVKIYETGSLKE